MIQQNIVGFLHALPDPASLGPYGSQTQPINIISSLDCGLSNPYRDVGPSPTQIAWYDIMLLGQVSYDFAQNVSYCLIAESINIFQ